MMKEGAWQICLGKGDALILGLCGGYPEVPSEEHSLLAEQG